MPDVILFKLSGDGSTLWSRRFGDGGMQFGQSVAIDAAGDIVMTGEMQGSVDFGDGPIPSAGAHDLFVAKFSATGDVLWHLELGDAMDQSSIVTSVDGAGATLLTGSFEGSVDFGCGPLLSEGDTDAFVAKLDPDGGTLWCHRLGDASPQAGTAIASDLLGNVTVVGKLWGTIQSGSYSVTAVGGPASDIFMAKFSP